MVIGVDIRLLAKGNPSGVSWYLRRLLDHLVVVDEENHYVLFFNSWHQPPLFLKDWASRPNVTVKIWRWPNKLLTAALLFARRPRLDRLIGGCDVFWSPNINFCSVSKQVKFVATIHDASFIRYPEFFTAKDRLRYRLINVARYVRRADRVVTISQSSRREIVRTFSYLADKIAMVYPGVEVSAAAAPINGLPDRFLLTLGTREPRKNLLGTIMAFEELRRRGPDIDLVIAGGQGWHNHEVTRHLGRSAVRNHIHIVGYVSEAQKHWLYQQAAAFVYPSWYEGFGFPPLEAMAANCPVVSSIAYGTAEISGPAALLVAPHRVDQLAEAVELALGPQRERLINQGRQRVADFSWSAAAAQMKKVFADVCALS